MAVFNISEKELDIIVDVISENIPGKARLSISYHKIQQMKGKDGCFEYLSKMSYKVAFYPNKIEIVQGKKAEPQFEDIKTGVTNNISLDTPKVTREESMLIAQATMVLEAYLIIEQAN